MVPWKTQAHGRALLLIAALFVADAAWGSMNTDPRLDQKIEVRASGEPLEAILAGVMRVKLDAASPMADTFLVCRYSGTVRGLMEAMAHYFAADRNHYPRWVRWGSPGHYRYRLQRERACAQYVADLRAHRGQEYASRVEHILRSPEAWPQRPFLRAFAALPAEEQRALLDGAQITRSIAQLAGEQSPEGFLRSLGAPKGAAVWDGGLVSLSILNPGTSRSSFYTLRSGDPARPSHSEWGTAPLSVFYPEANPDRAVQDWIGAFGDPTPKVAQPSHTWLFPNGGQVPDYVAFRHLADQSQANLIADAQGTLISRPFLPAAGSISEALEQLCHAGLLPVNQDPRGSWFWRRFRDTYLVRSIDWPEGETQVVPYRWVQEWQGSEKRDGCLSMEDILEIAALAPRQVRQLAAAFPQIEPLPAVQPLLRWYRRASRRLQVRIQTPGGVPLSELGITYQEALRDLEPGTVPPAYFAQILRVHSDRLHFSILWGKSGRYKDLARPALGVFLTEYENGKPVHSPAAMTVPLMR